MVSVIIPNYNHESFLKQRIESVLSQTFGDFEVIILDDFSKDNSRQVIEEYRFHPKVEHIEYNQVNSGSAFKQWKKGIELAKGEYIWIAESDDWCEPSLLEELMSAFIETDDLVLAHCQLIWVRDGIFNPTRDAKVQKEVIDGKVFNTKNMFGYNGIPNASSVVFKKSCFFNIGNEYLNMNYCGDWYVWSQICRQGNVFISDKYLNYFNKHGGDVSGKATSKGLDFTEGNLIFLKIVKQERPSRALIEAALDHRLRRLNMLQYSFTDPQLYGVLKSEILKFYRKFDLPSPEPQRPFIDRGKSFIKRVLKGPYTLLLKFPD